MSSEQGKYVFRDGGGSNLPDNLRQVIINMPPGPLLMPLEDLVKIWQDQHGLPEGKVEEEIKAWVDAGRLEPGPAKGWVQVNPPKTPNSPAKEG